MDKCVRLHNYYRLKLLNRGCVPRTSESSFSFANLVSWTRLSLVIHLRSINRILHYRNAAWNGTLPSFPPRNCQKAPQARKLCITGTAVQCTHAGTIPDGGIPQPYHKSTSRVPQTKHVNTALAHPDLFITYSTGSQPHLTRQNRTKATDKIAVHCG